VTNDPTLAIGGTNSALGAGESVQLSLDGGGTWQAVTQLTATTWGFDNTGATLSAGIHTFQTRVIDAGGNVGAVASQPVTIDMTVPSATSAITAIADDTGSLSSDFATSDQTLTIAGTNTALAAGEVVQISLDNGTTWNNAASLTGTTWSFDNTASPLAGGSYTFQTRVIDAAGNAGAASSQAVTIDTTASGSTSTIAAITTDSGAAGDFVTSDPTLAIAGTNMALGAGEAVQVSLDNGVTWQAVTQLTGTTWSFDNTASTLANGSHTFQTRVIDAVGNPGMTSSQTVVIDSAAPLAISAITAITTDSGASSSDFTTSDSTLLVGGSNSPLAAGESVQISLNGGATWQAVTQLTGTSWSFDNTASPLASGSHSFQTRVIDLAGNAGSASSQSVVIDTAAPGASSAITAITTDSGTGGDFVTSDNTLAISGTNTALGVGETVQLSLDGGATWVSTTPATATSWSYNNTGAMLADGSHTLQTRVIDAAGNTGAMSSQVVVIDTAAPSATSTITAVTADSGTAGDFITNDPTLVVSGSNTALNPGETVQLSLDGGATWTNTMPVTATSWSFDNTGATLAAGTYSFQTRVIDAAGLTGPASIQGVRIDTTVPAAPTLLGTDDVAAMTGAIANGSTTNDNVPVLSGTAQPNATVTLIIDGGAPVTVTANGAGAWNFIPAALANGAHSVSVTQTDAAGNVSPAATLAFTVDATAPAAPVFIGTDDVVPATGMIASGSTINDRRPEISGTTAEPNATVSITFTGPTNVTVTVVADGAGAWNFTPGADLIDGGYSVTVTQTDAAGNTSPAGVPLTFTLDSAAPLSISTIT
ncbi:MAG TPA: Ig-like domain-containing protein, partial [Burkholderiaceae bacterium]|nr:Ig-like domain-containing protein [Burkholderiaceae bacterium]